MMYNYRGQNTSNYDADLLGTVAGSSRQLAVSAEKDRKMIITELTGRASMFQEVPSQRYHNCQSPCKSIMPHKKHFKSG